jgi:hypothetical protein
LPTLLWRHACRTPTSILAARRLWFKTQLCFECHDPFMLKQFGGADALDGVAFEAAFQKVDARVAELVVAWELGRITLSNVVHDGPFVVHGCPGTAASGHFENHAAEGPDVYGTVATGRATANDLGRHVHGRAGHGALATLACVGGDGTTLAGDEFCGTKVNVLDYTVVVE